MHIVHGVGGAHLLAKAAADARLPVDRVEERDRLREQHVDRGPFAHRLVVLGDGLHGTVLTAKATASALVHVDEARTFDDPRGEVSLLALQGGDPGVGVEYDVGVAADADQLGGEGAHGAVVGGEGLVQFGHPPADAGPVLHHVHEYFGVGHVQGGLHAGDAGSDDQHGANGTRARGSGLGRLMALGPAVLGHGSLLGRHSHSTPVALYRGDLPR